MNFKQGLKRKENKSHELHKCFSKFGGVEYNTEERVVGHWIDGKPIYEISIVTDSPTYDVNNQLCVPIGAPIDTVVSIESWAYLPSDHTTRMMPYFSNTGVMAMKCAVFNHDDQVYTDSIVYYAAVANQSRLFTTVRFTKTTD